MLFRATAPGSIMLMGEHAVLHGQASIVCAVDRYLTVELVPRQDQLIRIQSEAFGEYQTELNQIELLAPYHFVLAVFKHFGERIRQGCDIHIKADFSDQLGLGSSAAVTVATFAAIVRWQGIRTSAIDMARQGRMIVRTVQGKASGADVAASVYGGMVAYQAQPVKVEKLNADYPLTLLYVGYKTPTVKVIERVEQHFNTRPELFRQICRAIGQASVDGIQAIRKKDWQGLGELFDIHQGLQQALLVCNSDLERLVGLLRQQDAILGAKISGSGLGDCVVGLGEAQIHELPLENAVSIPAVITPKGVVCEKV